MERPEIRDLIDEVINGKKNEDCIKILEEFVNYSERLLESFGVKGER